MRTILLALALYIAAQPVWAQETKRTPALREQVYSQLARAQQQADSGDVAGGLAILQSVEAKLSSMNSYERAMLWNFYGYMHYGEDRIDQAIEYFAKVVGEDPIPLSLRQNTLFSLAQLAMGQERYDATLEYLSQWRANASAQEQTKADVLAAQAWYQKADYQAALAPISRAIEEAEQSGYAAENWYVLQRAIYFELGQLDQVAIVLEKMVKAFNKPEHWVQLAGVYGQLGAADKQLAMLEAAYQLGFLSKGQDILNLAQSYFFAEIPYKAGHVVQQALDDGILEPNLRTLKLLAQSWVAAQETDRAVAALEAAAALSDDGELDAQRAHVLLNAEQHEQAIAAAELALERGQLNNPGQMYLVIGMAQLNLEQFNPALKAFAKAKEFEQAKRLATQWEAYTQAEQRQAETLKQLRSRS